MPIFVKFLSKHKMKDRIKQIMESQHMTQQVFADFVGIAPATLSGIFTERTKPTINTVEAIKKKLPAISTDWLLFGKGTMYDDQQSEFGKTEGDNMVDGIEGSKSTENDLFVDFNPQMSQFSQNSPISQSSQMPQNGGRTIINSNSVRNTRLDLMQNSGNNHEREPRRVTEIRVFYDDQTWESFVPAKKN